jgi:2-C-methyl-D-erythritol 2,4-cyclodiphosphate synthase
MYRIGNGYDVHRLVEGRKLILGGVDIPHNLGLDGHSDADAVVHALCDALLGACGAGDIGKHFPDTDDRWKGVSSLLLLEKVADILQQRGYQVANADCTIVAQKPKLAPHIEAMKANLASALNIETHRINIKATTTEHLGFAGREEGIAAYAVALLQEKPF